MESQTGNVGPASIGLDRYWNHYQYVQRWLKKHHQILKEAESSYDKLRHCSCHIVKVPPAPSSFNKSHSVSLQNLQKCPQPSASKSMTKPHKREARRKRKTGINSNFSAQTVTEKVEVNLNDEYLEFMLQSARHRKERDAKKSKEDKERMEVDSKGTLINDDVRIAPPTEQPGMRRTHEIKLLYGSQSDKVHGIETSQQLCFQQACDKLKPVPWPNIPLRLTFS
ncbi:GEMIN8 [Bugula neritina]|uniref:GEMIN8 n=1 Tax=Bugula neritina TaxID=10212 RepID=A0A7J7KQQ3_BUGNE|nr:GEMIN8 [Bugula neritina]